MRKSEVVMQKLNQAEVHLMRAVSLVEQVLQMDEDGNGSSGGEFMAQADGLVDLLNELGYEIAMPMQTEEEARDEEIERLEARLAQLRAQ